MTVTQNTIVRLTDPGLPSSQRYEKLRDFAHTFGWRPSDALIEYPGAESLANGHLVVEHGLDITAVITFLKYTHPFYELRRDDRINILSISYNNLVDWHLFPDREGLTVVLNRAEPIVPKRQSAFEDPDIWRAEAFERITNDHPSPNLKNLDQALIETISIWKRSLAAELGSDVRIDNLSALFNAILFVRALEDHRRFEHPNTNRALLDNWDSKRVNELNVGQCIASCLARLGAPDVPGSILDTDLLNVFSELDRETVSELFRDFYTNRFAPYNYDFSLMSKHALSRIYEKYVSLLRDSDSDQLTFFPDLPEEELAHSLGTHYTPQYIARFFARFLKNNLTPHTFRRLRISDPACGSGIFLRTTLEMQFEPFQMESPDRDVIKKAFCNALGIDIDPNACHATRLSLALLHLVLTGEFPESLNVENSDSLEHFSAHPELRESFDAVVANPPYIKWDDLDEETRVQVVQFMESFATGRVDMFLAHLKLGTELVKPGGYLLYVLPHSFLIGRNASKLREWLPNEFWVRCLVDLSEIAVFGDVRSYVILLILERKAGTRVEEPKATIVRCREFVGHALNDAIEGRSSSTDFYQVYDVEQNRFFEANWEIGSPTEVAVFGKISRGKRLDEFLWIREGFVTGADDVFLVNDEMIPEGEKAVFVSYLPDRDMLRFAVPNATGRSVFYPYVNGERLTEEQLQNGYPKTWEYLLRHRNLLQRRRPVIKGELVWWSPARPRIPSNMMRPKIVSPHLIVLPRFSLDATGKYAVSHCPLLYPREEGSEVELLQFFLAVLNSSVSMAQIVKLSHKYSRGYAMLEPKTLKLMTVPDPAMIDRKVMKQIQTLVSRRISNLDNIAIDDELDDIVADMYGLTRAERIHLGMEA